MTLAAPLLPTPTRPKSITLAARGKLHALLLSTGAFLATLHDINAASFGVLLIPTAMGLPHTAGMVIYLLSTLSAQVVLLFLSGESYATGGTTVEVIPLLMPIALLAASDEDLTHTGKVSTLLALFALTSGTIGLMYAIIWRLKLAGIFRCIPLIVLKSALTGIGVFLLISSVKLGVGVVDDGPPLQEQLFGTPSAYAKLGATLVLFACLYLVQAKIKSPFATLGLLDLVSLESAALAAAAECGGECTFDLNREIGSIGGANVLSACLGGVPCYMMLSPSLVSLRFTKGSGGRAGPYVALLTALSLPAVGAVVAAVPRFVVGAFVLDMGVGFIVETGVETLRLTVSPVDRALVFIVPAMMIYFDFLPGLLTGLVISLVHFVLSYSSLPIVHHVQTVAQISSNAIRPRLHRKILAKYGHHNVTIVSLQGFLMFGSTPQLGRAIDETLRRRDEASGFHGGSSPSLHRPPWFILLDARNCRGCDFGGALEMLKMKDAVARKGGELRVLAPPKHVAAALQAASSGRIGDALSRSFQAELKRVEDAIIDAHARPLPTLESLQLTPSDQAYVRAGLTKTQRGDHEAVVTALTPHMRRVEPTHVMAAATLLEKAEIRAVAADASLWAPTDRSDFYVIVLSGCLSLARGAENTVVETAAAGAIIGYGAHEVEGASRETRLVADEPSRVLVVTHHLSETIRVELPSLDRLLLSAMLSHAANEIRCFSKQAVVEPLGATTELFSAGFDLSCRTDEDSFSMRASVRNTVPDGSAREGEEEEGR